MQECDKECKQAAKRQTVIGQIGRGLSFRMSYVADIAGDKRVIRASRCSSLVVDKCIPVRSES